MNVKVNVKTHSLVSSFSLTLILLSFFWILCATWSVQYFSRRKSQKILPTREFTHVGWPSVEHPPDPGLALGSAPAWPPDPCSSLWFCREKQMAMWPDWTGMRDTNSANAKPSGPLQMHHSQSLLISFQLGDTWYFFTLIFGLVSEDVFGWASNPSAGLTSVAEQWKSSLYWLVLINRSYVKY